MRLTAGDSIILKSMKIHRTLRIIALFALWNCRLPAADPLPRADVMTSEGNILIELDRVSAPKAVAQFRQFISNSVYDDSTFDQVPDGNEIQGGKPGPKCRIELSGAGNFSSVKAPPGEFALKHTVGAVVFARTVGSCNPDKTCNSSQFCIYLEDKPQNEGEFTVFGRVVEGMDVVRKIAARINQDAKRPVKIESVRMVDPKTDF